MKLQRCNRILIQILWFLVIIVWDYRKAVSFQKHDSQRHILMFHIEIITKLQFPSHGLQTSSRCNSLFPLPLPITKDTHMFRLFSMHWPCNTPKTVNFLPPHIIFFIQVYFCLMRQVFDIHLQKLCFVKEPIWELSFCRSIVMVQMPTDAKRSSQVLPFRIRGVGPSMDRSAVCFSVFLGDIYASGELKVFTFPTVRLYSSDSVVTGSGVT